MVLAQRPTDMRRHNLSLVLQTIRSHPAISRVELSRKLGLTRAALTGLVAELLKLGLVMEDGTAASSTGRPRTFLRPTSENFLGIGVDARLDRLKAVAVDLTGRVMGSAIAPIPEVISPAELCCAIQAIVDLVSVPLQRRVIGIGVAVPCNSDGSNVSQPSWGWHQVPLGNTLSQLLGFPVLIRDISQTACLANARHPDLIGYSRVLHLQLGRGAGMGLTTGGEINPHLPLTWGRIGHAPLGDPTRLCDCGRHGCLDASIGFDAFVTDCVLSPVRPSHGPTGLNRFAAAIAAAAATGDWSARQAIQRLRTHLARALAVLAQIEGPDAVTLGGYPVFLGEEFLTELGQDLAERLCTESPLRHCEYGDDASVIGAALIGLDHGLRDPLRAVAGARTQKITERLQAQS